MSFTSNLMSLGSMSHVDFKKCPCCCDDFRGQRPFYYELYSRSTPPKPQDVRSLLTLTSAFPLQLLYTPGIDRPLIASSIIYAHDGRPDKARRWRLRQRLLGKGAVKKSLHGLYIRYRKTSNDISHNMTLKFEFYLISGL